MNDKHDLEPLDGLPRELAELDRELSQLNLDERPSFGPELRNNLARAAAVAAVPPRRSWIRYAAAAAIAGIAVVGVSAPPLRASIAEGLQALMGGLQQEPAADEEAAPRVVRVQPRAPEASPPPLAGSGIRVAETEPAGEGGGPEPSQLPVFQPMETTFPSLEDTDAARDLVRSYYPAALQRAGIGGVAHLTLWVDQDGAVNNVQLGASSGLEELDRAAVAAATSLRFVPGRRNGAPLGTWVEFDLVFDATEMARSLDPADVDASSEALEPDNAPAPFEQLETAVIRDDDGSMLRILATLPEAFREPAESGEIEARLFVLDAVGAVIDQDGDGEMSGGGFVEWAVPATPEAATVVIDLYHPETGGVAGIRIALES